MRTFIIALVSATVTAILAIMIDEATTTRIFR